MMKIKELTQEEKDVIASIAVGLPGIKRFKYVYSLSEEVRWDFLTDIKYWLSQNITTGTMITLKSHNTVVNTHNAGGVLFIFDSDKDAMLFKLTFGGRMKMEQDIKEIKEMLAYLVEREKAVEAKAQYDQARGEEIMKAYKETLDRLSLPIYNRLPYERDPMPERVWNNLGKKGN